MDCIISYQKNFREVATKEEIHNAINIIKNDLNIENDVNGVGYHKKKQYKYCFLK